MFSCLTKKKIVFWMEIVCKNLLAALMIGVVDIDTVLPWQTPLIQLNAVAWQSEGDTQPVDKKMLMSIQSREAWV